MADALRVIFLPGTIQSPSFTCEACGKGVGSSKASADAPWQPQPCFHCREKTQRKAAAKRRRENPRVLAGVDIDAAVADLRTVAPLGELLGKRKIRVDVGHAACNSCGGRAWTRQRRIRIYGGPASTPERVLEVVLHELVHLALPDREIHGERFRRVFARAVFEAWGLDIPIDVERERHANRSYKMGELVVAQLRELLVTGAVKTYAPEPTQARPSRASRTAALVEKRAAHATKMLAKAERKLKLAKTVHAKWRTKVAYYERVAARKKP